MEEKVLSFPTEAGMISVAVSGGAVTRVSFADENGADEDQLLLEAAEQIREYLHGDRTSYCLPVRLDGVTKFTRTVLEETARVPYGSVLSYGALSERTGGSPRAVGGALGRNPLPLIIPCHRIVRSNGHLGGFTGGLHIKERLLQIELRQVQSS
ncbi:MAG: methylated-DNA--[protein]-cysteine S-methyltransferase [bacterium]|nr:methylated-DNA--[protein]-cysteine S-methyltransferase [bacterium]